MGTKMIFTYYRNSIIASQKMVVFVCNFQPLSLVKQFDIAQSAKFGKNKMKLETASFVAKKELPISKFKQIHGLEVKHDMQLGEAYANDTSAGVMIDLIGYSIALDLKNTLENHNFFSF